MPLILLRLSVGDGAIVIGIAIAIYSIYSTLLRKRPSISQCSFAVATMGLGTFVLAPITCWRT